MSFLVAAPQGELPFPPWAIPLFFVGIWLFVMFIISRVGGWSTLAGYYRTDQPFFGTLFRFQSASLRAGTNYNGCLNFGANTEGLYMVPMLIFRGFHAPLFIPWSEIIARPIKYWKLFDYVELRFQRAPGVPVRIKPRLAAKLAQASVERFRVAPAGSVGN